MPKRTTSKELTVKSIDILVDPTTQSVGFFVKTEGSSPFMLRFSQSLAQGLVTGTLDSLKVLIGASPPTKPGELAIVVEKFEIGTAFPDRVWLVLHSLAYGRHSYSFLPPDARLIGQQLEAAADEVEREISSGPKH